MAKKKTEIQELSEFIRDHMVTKSDFTGLKQTLDEHTSILNEHTSLLNEHTRDLNIIKNDVKTNLDKRLTLEVRVTNIEKKVFGSSQEHVRQ